MSAEKNIFNYLESKEFEDNESYRDSIATVDEKGKRVWVYPKKISGWLFKARTYLSWVLLVFLFGMPFVKYNGEPLLLFNVLERRFIIFGVIFTPQDFHLFVLAMLTFMVFVVLFTAVFGRLFCGWVCPQTIFMEMVFRKIEYLIEGDAGAQRKLNQGPWTTEKMTKKIGKQVVFFIIAVLVANTFLSYLIGIDQVLKIASEPVRLHLWGFIAMILFSFAFYFVFSYMREQVCIAICPYGRMQGVLLDKNSIVVAYDFVRGEPRGKIKKKQEDNSSPLGDCIDCKLCVHVCPTGIDIRNGVQLECVNCTACIDACDTVMEKVNRPKGLIRYDSYTGIVEKRKRIFTPRVIAYSIVLVLLIGINLFLLGSRTQVEAVVQRAKGSLFQKVNEDSISNLYNYQLFNKTKDTLAIEVFTDIPGAVIRYVGTPPVLMPNEMTRGTFFIQLGKDQIFSRKTSIQLKFTHGKSVIATTSTNFYGPGN